MKFQLLSKEVSWLAFNDRVLQEAADKSVPLLERLRFLGIYSSNRDEFFRVRVATLHRLALLGKKAIKLTGHDPRKVLDVIDKKSILQQDNYERIYRRIVRDLKTEGIIIVNERKLTREQLEFVNDYFLNEVRPRINPIMLDQVEDIQLRDSYAYLLVELQTEQGRAHIRSLIEIPTRTLPRFIELPSKGREKHIIMLDDVIRQGLDRVFPMFRFKSIIAHTVKITRDAEIEINDDVTEGTLEKMEKALKQRRVGDTVRFVYDEDMPKRLLRAIREKLGIEKSDTIIAGGRYHNFKDFMRFPTFGRRKLLYDTPEPVPVRKYEITDYFEELRRKDLLLHLPYQSFDHVVSFLRQASIDPNVRSIRICLYRLAKNSSIINALINAALNGKKVTAVLELAARFDEEANIAWSQALGDAGVRVVYGVPNRKVHAKICLIERSEGKKRQRYAILSTGNFNEDTARVYSDHTLMTAERKITNDLVKVFDMIDSHYGLTPFRNLIVSPFNTRNRILKFIDTEIENHKKGRPSGIFLKLNNLVDDAIILRLIKAARAGVPVRLIVRSMFCLPDMYQLPDNFEAVGIVDRYLEHSRIYCFENGGTPRYLLSSADLMQRNLDRRIEVTFPVYDKDHQEQLKAFMELQWEDNVKSRIWENTFSNAYRRTSGREIRSQTAFYRVLSRMLSSPSTTS